MLPFSSQLLLFNFTLRQTGAPHHLHCLSRQSQIFCCAFPLFALSSTPPHHQFPCFRAPCTTSSALIHFCINSNSQMFSWIRECQRKSSTYRRAALYRCRLRSIKHCYLSADGPTVSALKCLSLPSTHTTRSFTDLNSTVYLQLPESVGHPRPEPAKSTSQSSETSQASFQLSILKSA